MTALGADTFRRLVSPDGISDEVAVICDKVSWAFEVMPKPAEVEEAIAKPRPRARKSNWDSVFAYHLRRLHDDSPDALEPLFVPGSKPLRFEGQYVEPAEPRLEHVFRAALRRWLWDTWLRSHLMIAEFGSGAGEMIRDVCAWGAGQRYIAFDWSPPALEIARRLGAEARQFDLLEPDPFTTLPPSTAVLTISALEQTGRDHRAFIAWLAETRPAVCVHVEPIVEWLDDTPFDDAMRRYIVARDWLQGLPATILGVGGEIIHQRRVRFGSLFSESYNVLVWRPR